jgi:hypothetical protein
METERLPYWVIRVVWSEPVSRFAAWGGPDSNLCVLFDFGMTTLEIKKHEAWSVIGLKVYSYQSS